jgi:hypothetical protein
MPRWCSFTSSMCTLLFDASICSCLLEKILKEIAWVLKLIKCNNVLNIEIKFLWSVHFYESILLPAAYENCIFYTLLYIFQWSVFLYGKRKEKEAETRLTRISNVRSLRYYTLLIYIFIYMMSIWILSNDILLVASLNHLVQSPVCILYTRLACVNSVSTLVQDVTREHWMVRW